MSASKSIAYKMTKTVVLLTLFLGLVIGSVQVAWDYRTRLDDLNNRVIEVLNSIEKAAVKAVYTFDTDLAAEVASGLFEFPPISSVSILDENNKLMTTIIRYPGTLPYEWITQFIFKEHYTFTVPLMIKNDETQPIGTLSITVAPHQTADAFLSQSVTTLAAAILQSFVVSILLLFAFYKTVTRPLHLLANDFTKINPEVPEKSTLSLDPHLRSTEFEEVTKAGNNLLKVIGSQLRAKDLAETELKKQKNETERYLKIAEAIILQLDKTGRILMINQRGLDVLGYKSHDVIGRDWFELAIQEDERDTIKNVFLDLIHRPPALGETTSSYYENYIITKEGKERRIFWHNALEVDRDGHPVGVLSSGQDVTARKEAEDALRQTEGSLRAIIEATSEGFAITDLHTMKLIDVNASLYKMLGYSREEMLFDNLSNFINPKDWDIVTSYVSNADTQPHRSYEIRMQRRDGTDVPVEINASNLPLDEDQHQRSVAFITNISARKAQEESQRQLETQLRQAQKMETIGTLAGGIAHDFNNILTPILGYSSLLSSRIPEDDPNHARIQQIAKSANRAANMVKQILTFSRRSEGEMVSTLIGPEINEALQLVRSTIPANIEINQQIDDDCPPVIADTTQIQQLILNLCTNAAHAMEKDGGILEVSLKQTTVNEELARTSPNLSVGPYLLIQIKDSGHGMDEETLSRIFDPFYTTKKSGEGTGLGLAMVHGIVQNHNAEVLVKSTIDHGSIFSIYIPISESPITHVQKSEQLTHGNQEVALVVDDEKLNTDFIYELLLETGYEAECYNDSIEALDAFMSNPDKYNIILTDQSMPKLTGDQLVKAVREIVPDLPILMMSGYDKNITNENATDFGVDYYLQKPVELNELTRAMSQLLQD